MQHMKQNAVCERFACLDSRGLGGLCRPDLRGFQVFPRPQELHLGHLSLSPARECSGLFIFFATSKRMIFNLNIWSAGVIRVGLSLLLKVIGVSLTCPPRIRNLFTTVPGNANVDDNDTLLPDNLVLEEAMVRSAGTESR